LPVALSAQRLRLSLVLRALLPLEKPDADEAAWLKNTPKASMLSSSIWWHISAIFAAFFLRLLSAHF
jgi:hypothetical protein